MASIDAFLDLAASEPVSKPALRVSLRYLQPLATPTIDPHAARQRALILLGVVLLHVLLLLALREAMRQLPVARGRESVPLQITFIERHAAPAVSRPIVMPSPVPRPHAIPTLPRSMPRSDALQAVTIAPHATTIAAVPALSSPPQAVLYDADGVLRVPAAPMPSPPRDLLAHRSVSFMLPGGDRTHSPDFHVREGNSPKKVVDTVGAYLFGGGQYDPCPYIALDMVDLDDAKAREQAEERYERSCEGH